MTNLSITHSLSLSLSRSYPIEIMAMEVLLNTFFRIKRSSLHRLPRIRWEASQNIHKTHRNKNLCSSLIEDMEIWLKDEMQYTCFMIHQQIPLWRRHFCNTNISWYGKLMWRLMLHTHYSTYVAPNYKTIFFIKKGNHTHLTS